ncbi:NAD(P)-binding Rossmann-fold superfamily protein [Abeliophyllum distichum]|uniref:NAD(P)-binding Rossmann-fold superfamily protein n=1 Tax=Abeliophyllum distichum TaxID=126358 RepID=A0ABD1Q263_9LAMI
MEVEEEQKFPPQRQEQQPGKQHIMDPIPQALNPDYRQANKLRGKVAIVTGGDSGIGRACLPLLCLRGCNSSLHIRFDENCKMVVDEVVNNYGGIDILIDNAAEQHLSNSIEEITEGRLERVFRTNIFSHFFHGQVRMRHALKHMKEGSSITNSTSVHAYCGSPMVLDYSSTNGAIVAFTRALALHLVSKGNRVNAVAAGLVCTPLQVASLPEEMITKLGSETLMGNVAQPHEIAPSYVFLASPESSYYTGQVLHPNVLLVTPCRRSKR